MRLKRVRLWVLMACVCSVLPQVQAATLADSVALDSHNELKVESESSTFKPNPRSAVLWSLIPGGGQIYNRKYWKIPIILGAYTACYYAISWNNVNLKEYSEAYRDIKSDKPLENNAWFDFVPINAKPEDYVNNSSFQDQLKRGRDFYRRNRDLSIIVSAGVYFLVMIDAYVDAELFRFDISPDLALSYGPVVHPPDFTNPSGGYGVAVALSF